MKFNLKEECENSEEKEFFFGAKTHKKIKDAYLGLCYLDPHEKDRKVGPGKGHEEILYLINGKIRINSNNSEILIEEGEAFFMQDGHKIFLNNLSDQRSFFTISGGHTKHRSH